MAMYCENINQAFPLTPSTNLSYSQCGVLLDSVESLNVHNTQYHSDLINRWSAQTSGPNKSTSIASNSPTHSENNNQPKHNIHKIQNSSGSGSPLNNTISAAADSSDNHSSTTQQSSTIETMQPPISYGGYGMSNAPSSFPHQQSAPEMNYQAYHGYYHPPMGYAFGHPQILNNQPPPCQENQPVPSAKYHMANSAPPNSINHSASPLNVSSSSLIKNSNVMWSSTSSSIPMISKSQPTPSLQCDKCGQICETTCQLNDHHTKAHAEISSFSYAEYMNEELGDIFDLDSHKMIYPPTEEPNQNCTLSSMDGWYPNEHSIIWTQEIPTSVIKSKHGHQQQPCVKGFNNDVNTNQMTTSLSEFPSTTTPQDGRPQFRPSFEAATSSLPTSAPTSKSSSWKSNEARRPKTYYCTACNKWFTSSAHLKRHYNTALHKNALKSSGQPDPASVPINYHQHSASAATQSPSPPVEYSSASTSSTENSIEMDSSIKCNECDKVFNRICYLTQHKQSRHSGEKPFKCYICGKRYPSVETLEHHQEKHNAIKPFKCDKENCEKSFHHKTDLRRHMQLHTGVTAYLCDYCGKGFSRSDHMVKHKNIHTRILAVA